MAKMTNKKVTILLSDVTDNKRFWCVDDRASKNLAELVSALNDVSAEAFAYHLSEARNDFANWVRDVIRDKTLASDLVKLLNQTEAAKRLVNRVSFLSNELTWAGHAISG